MPQVVATRRTGHTLDFDLTRSPSPVNLNFKLDVSRERRATRTDQFNESLTKGALPANNMEPHHWQGHGRPGHIQYISGGGRHALRGGEKLQRDMLAATLPFENAKPLNDTQMGGHGVGHGFLETAMPGPRALQAHEASMHSIRTFRAQALHAERNENGHCHRRNDLEDALARQRRLEEQVACVPGVRTAGLASINPRMGTCGSLPDIRKFSGADALDAFRQSTPWAIAGPYS